RKKRIRRTEKENRKRRYVERSKGQGAAGTQKARSHAAYVRRIHRFPQLSRLAACGSVEEALQRDSQHFPRRKGLERRSLWSGENQGAHPRISRRPAIGQESERFDPLLRRPSGSR